MLKQKTHCAVLLIAITLLLMTGFQMRQIINERSALSAQYDAQEEPLGKIKQITAQFESLAVGTARLAGDGNESAKKIMAGLNQIGINVNPNATEGQKSLEFKTPQAPEATTSTDSAPATPAAPAAVGN